MHFDVASRVPMPQLMLLKDTGNPVKSSGPTTCTSIWSIEFGGILDCKSEFARGRLRVEIWDHNACPNSHANHAISHHSLGIDHNSMSHAQDSLAWSPPDLGMFWQSAMEIMEWPVRSPKIQPKKQDLFKCLWVLHLVSLILQHFCFTETSAGWWFGTFYIFPYIGNIIIPTDEVIFWVSGLRLRGSFGGGQLALDSSAPWWDDMAGHGPSGTSGDPWGQLFLGHHINSHEPNSWLLAL